MSTRCQLGIYANESEPIEKTADGVYIYRHSDGYPDGVLPDILEFLKRFNEQRGIGDTSYCTARLVQHLTNTHDGFMQHIAREQSKSDGPVIAASMVGVLGCGVDKWLHDIEYFYHISPTKLKVFKVTYNKKVWKRQAPSKWEMVSEHSLVVAEKALG